MASRHRFKIIVTIGAAFIITIILTRTVFRSSSPKTDNQYIAKLSAKSVNLLLHLLIKPTPTLIPTPIKLPTQVPTPTVQIPNTITKPIPSITKDRTKITPTKKGTTPTNVPTQAVSNGQLSSSKLGIFILSDYSGGAKNIVSSGPRIIKVMDPQSNGGMMNAMKEYKSKYPNGVILARFYFEAPGNSIDTNPVNAAENVFNTYIKPQINKLGDALKYVDYIETPNEIDSTQSWDSITKTQWNAQFWTRLADLYNQAGTKICAGSIPVANIGDNNSYEGIGQFVKELVLMLREVKQVGGVWCYHGYTLNYTTDLNEEIWTSLRYRVFYDYLQKNASDVADIPMIISETGVDKTGDPKTSGWQPRGSQKQFEDWLTWYDGQIKQDSYIIGATIFQIGDSNWSSFNAEPISGWLSDYLKNNN